jgi:uncharacterized membrane protein YdjX (TVP38/TMEM64 family)
VAGLLARRPRARRVVELLAERRGLWVVAALRVFPLGHYTLVSYAAGLSSVRRGAFLLGTVVGLVPGATIYPIAGDAALRPGSPAFVISVAAVLVVLVVSLVAGRRLLGRPAAPPSAGAARER